MDPEVVDDPAYAAEMKAALLALPSISIVLKMEDIFGASKGIYIHPLERGPQWERPCSMEFLPADGKGFQIDAGIQMQGNSSRDPLKQPKHAMRILFKGDYGARKLSYKLFPDSAVNSFDTLVLRADYNFSWLHWNPIHRMRGQRTRDAWLKDSLRAMGSLASHNRYVHLYINGLYWGVYDPSERPDASFGEAYLGGSKGDYDVVNEGALVDGSLNSYTTLLGFREISTMAQYDAIKKFLDIPQFIDYTLLHFFVGHEDWGNNKNWYAIRPKNGSRGFIYLPWDGETLLGDPKVDRVNNPDVPSGLHTKLLANAQYRSDFADRVQRHFFHDGALTPEQNIRRWNARAREIELPIIAESARWGDYRRDVHRYQEGPFELYTRDRQWRTEQARLLNSYFPGRTETVLSQLRAAGLYPSVAAPSFSQMGGKMEENFELRMSAAEGTIYYSTNGADPRGYGTGALSTSAIAYTNPLKLSGDTVVKARVLVGDSWSALTDARFVRRTLRNPLRVTEIMYNPEPAGDAYEYIELQNMSSLPFDASGYSFRGVSYIFPPGAIIPPGKIIVLSSSENPASFASRYGNIAVFRRFGGQLLNRGERLEFIAPSGERIYSIDYEDGAGWPKAADGRGASLEVNDPFGDPDSPANWHASVTGGSPGIANSLAADPAVRFSEICAAPQTGPDWIELWNTRSIEIDLGGWQVSKVGNTNTLTFPAGTLLAAGAYRVIPCDKLAEGPGPRARFGISSESDCLILNDANGTRADIIVTGPQAKGYSMGWVDHRTVLCDPTPGEANRPAVQGSTATLVINEWLANSATTESDWLELYNSDPVHPVALKGLWFKLNDQPFEITSDAFVGPNDFVQLFADEKPGPDHLDFKLPAEGGTIAVLSADERFIDSVTYGPQSESVSSGYYPDGTRNLVSFPTSATPGKANSLRFPITSAINPQEFKVIWQSSIGTTYRVEWSEDLQDWQALSELLAAGPTASAVDSPRFNHRYYRVVAVPR